MVSVPLRGKEGAGQKDNDDCLDYPSPVSVPLRGKEGAGRLISISLTIAVPSFRPLAG